MKNLKEKIKSNKNTYLFFYFLINILSKFTITFLVFFEMQLNSIKIFLNKKVKLRRAHFYNNDVRKKIFKNLILQQIKNFKKNKKNDDVFVLIEIGSLIGDSIEVWGTELNKKIKKFLIISIDPFDDYVNEEEKKKYTTLKIRSNKTNQLFKYFVHNNSLLKFRKNIIHIRDYSNNALNYLLKLNIKSDFIYIDGAHDYKNIKQDFILSKKLIYKSKKYNGTICGDDHYVVDNEYKKFGLNKSKFLNLLYKNRQKELLTLNTMTGNKYRNITFHPGIAYFFSISKETFIQLKDGLWKLKI